jgi:importin subunit alpha-1
MFDMIFTYLAYVNIFLYVSSYFVFMKFYFFLQEAAWAISNIAAGTLAHKQLIFSSGAVSPLLHLLATATFDIRKEVAFALGNLCVTAIGKTGETKPVLEHLTVFVDRGCLPGFINLVKSPDIEAARLGLQFLELVS